MNKHINQNGFGHIAIVFVLLFVAVAGFAGYKVLNANKADTTAVSAVAATPTAPAKISSKADLVQTSKALDASSSQVDGSLNDNSLNSSLNDML